jgi:predicted CXXCH cytochrome family protein
MRRTRLLWGISPRMLRQMAHFQAPCSGYARAPQAKMTSNFPFSSLFQERGPALPLSRATATFVHGHFSGGRMGQLSLVHRSRSAPAASRRLAAVLLAVLVCLLTTARASTPVALCLTCHADMKAADIKGVVHPPAVRDCLGCHNPHHSDNKNLLLKPTSGGEKENLCLQCHRTGLDVPEKGSRHAVLDMGCDTCHLTHKTGADPTPENRFHLTKNPPELCQECHDIKDADLQKAHNNQPFGNANCLECHDPHQSDQPKLMRQFLHAPFEAKACDTCHAPSKDGTVVLTQADSKSLCLTCHDDKGKEIESAKVPHPGAAGDCTDCHSPHAASQPGLPKTDAVAICLSCHTDIDELRKKPAHHQPAFTQGCATCHTPHGGDIDHLLRAKGNDLCLECHGPDAAAKPVPGQHLVTIFNGQVRLPDDYFSKNRVVVLPLRYGLGHPVDGHPVSDVMDPADKTKVKTPLSCLSCHQPHASAQPGLLAKDRANNMAFCDTCHTNRLNMNETVTPKD